MNDKHEAMYAALRTFWRGANSVPDTTLAVAHAERTQSFLAGYAPGRSHGYDDGLAAAVRGLASTRSA